MPSPLAGAIVLSDGESDMDTEEKLPAQSPGLDCSFVIFRVPHHHPHRLKRPLAHSDELVFGDLAIRVYAVASFKEEQGVELKVQRTDTADIHLADLFGFGEKTRQFLQTSSSRVFTAGLWSQHCLLIQVQTWFWG